MKLNIPLNLISLALTSCAPYAPRESAVNNRFKGVFHGELPVIFKDEVVAYQGPPTWFFLPPTPGQLQPTVSSFVGVTRTNIESRLGGPSRQYQNISFVGMTRTKIESQLGSPSRQYEGIVFYPIR
jgi:hypothetical protein